MNHFTVLLLLAASATAVVLTPPDKHNQPLNAFLEFGKAVEGNNARSNDPNVQAIDLKSLVKKDAKEIKGVVERMLFSDESPDAKHDKLIELNDLLRQEIMSNMAESRRDRRVRERRLDDNTSITRAQVAQGNDDISTSSRLNDIKQQERAMSNYQKVHFWLDDVNFKMNDLRSNINRRLQDMSVGLQRRSLLLGHYNYVGQGIGSPSGESMADMDPYFHF